MAEVNQDLVQQLEQNLAAFEGAGLDDEAKSVRAKLAKVKGEKPAPKKEEPEPDVKAAPVRARKEG